MGLNELMQRNRWCYHLVKSSPGINKNEFRVSIVVENEPGHFPTGGGDKEPWYWTEACCRAQNEKRGISEEDALDIIGSSMFSRRN